MKLIVNTCEVLGIEEISFFVFGIENLKRSKEETDTLYGIFQDLLTKDFIE